MEQQIRLTMISSKSIPEPCALVLAVLAPVFQLIAALGILDSSNILTAGPPYVMRDMPGKVEGRIKTEWLDPFVSATTRSIGPDRWTAIDWFETNGKLSHSLAGYDVLVQSGFVCQFGSGKTNVFGILGDWKIELPQKSGPAGYLTGIDNTFIHEFHPNEDQIAADIYISGKLVNSIGPYVQHLGEDVRVGEDGSAALLAWKLPEKKVTQVVSIDANGKLRFQVEADPLLMAPAPAPNGDGVLAGLNTPDEDRKRFIFYQASGKKSSLIVAPNGEVAVWLPSSTTALMQTSIGYEYRWRLINWSTGRQVWEIGDVTTLRVPGSGAPVFAADNYLLFGTLEYLDNGQSKISARRIYAVNVANGQVVARWLPSPSNQPVTDVGRFRKVAGKLYLVTDEVFSQIDLRSVSVKTNGWQ
jgi:hypothetical protein